MEAERPFKKLVVVQIGDNDGMEERDMVERERSRLN